MQDKKINGLNLTTTDAQEAQDKCSAPTNTLNAASRNRSNTCGNKISLNKAGHSIYQIFSGQLSPVVNEIIAKIELSHDD